MNQSDQSHSIFNSFICFSYATQLRKFLHIHNYTSCRHIFLPNIIQRGLEIRRKIGLPPFLNTKTQIIQHASQTKSYSTESDLTLHSAVQKNTAKGTLLRGELPPSVHAVPFTIQTVLYRITLALCELSHCFKCTFRNLQPVSYGISNNPVL